MATIVTGDMYEKLDGQLHELKRQIRQRGGYPHDPQSLVAGLQKLIDGNFGTNISCSSVDLSSAPFIPDGWSVEEHQKGGQFVWDPTKVRLHLDEGQTDRRYVEGHKLRKLISKKNPYNANLLDFLLKNGNQHLIPEEWKGKAVFFWGTIYRNSDGNLYVRYLYWRSRRWYWDYYWLDDVWDDVCPALVPA